MNKLLQATLIALVALNTQAAVRLGKSNNIAISCIDNIASPNGVNFVKVQDNKSDWFKIKAECLRYDRTESADSQTFQIFVPITNNNGSEAYLLQFPEAQVAIDKQTAENGIPSKSPLPALLPKVFSQKLNRDVATKDVWCAVANVTDTQLEFEVMLYCRLDDNKYAGQK